MSHTKIKEIKIDKSLAMILKILKLKKIRDFSSFVFDQPTDGTRNVTMAFYYRTKSSIMSLKTLYRRTLKKGGVCNRALAQSD
ncbi:hypothetical protein ACT1UH_00095 [Mycoplasma sp. 332]|uniref:hypothetical protein n=1 Tax=Mycoplasma sp. 332 TaxID=3458236 RepID=UPI004035A96E